MDSAIQYLSLYGLYYGYSTMVLNLCESFWVIYKKSYFKIKFLLI